MKTQRAIFRCLNKECKHVWAYDYQYDKSAYDAFRMEGDKKVLFIVDNKRCSKCDRLSTKVRLVQSTHSESHKCGASCFAAVGADCKCECNGEGHGKMWLLA